MTGIEKSYLNALLADGAYSSFWDQKNSAWLSKDVIHTNLTTDLSEPQADFILSNFDILTQTLSSTGGFDAVVWRGKPGSDYAGQVYVSMRGTLGATDIVNDVALASRGLPYDEVADMVNWWTRATGSPGAKVNQVKVQTSLTVVGESHTLTHTFAADTPTIATGELNGKVNTIAGVNGHSLGGYLATAFTRLFGKNVAEVTTFNSAGFSDAAEANIRDEFRKIENLLGTAAQGAGSFESAGLKQTNFKAGNGVSVTTNDWGEVPYWALGFNQYGKKVALYQEDTLGGNLFANHSMFKLTDYLALGSALEKLAPSLTFAQLNAMVQAGSNDKMGSRMRIIHCQTRPHTDP